MLWTVKVTLFTLAAINDLATRNSAWKNNARVCKNMSLIDLEVSQNTAERLTDLSNISGTLV
jgi:hypothetical protein